MGRDFSPEHPAAVLKVTYEDLSRQPHTTEAELRYQPESADIVVKYLAFT
jgi:hypothetical protein